MTANNVAAVTVYSIWPAWDNTICECDREAIPRKVAVSSLIGKLQYCAWRFCRSPRAVGDVVPGR
jgi:hypothetical protein